MVQTPVEENGVGHVSTHFAISLCRFLMSAKTDKKQKESHERFQWDRKIGEVLGRKIREKRICHFEMILKSFITFFFLQLKTLGFILRTLGLFS